MKQVITGEDEMLLRILRLFLNEMSMGLPCSKF